MLTFFAEHFTGTKAEARRVLEESTYQTRAKDIVGVSFFGGMSLLMVMIGVFFGVTPASDESRKVGRQRLN